MDIGFLEVGAFGASAAIAMKSLEFAIATGRQKLNGKGKGADALVLHELKTLNTTVTKAVGNFEKGLEMLDDTRERVKENQASIDKMHRDILMARPCIRHQQE